MRELFCTLCISIKLQTNVICTLQTYAFVKILNAMNELVCGQVNNGTIILHVHVQFASFVGIIKMYSLFMVACMTVQVGMSSDTQTEIRCCAIICFYSIQKRCGSALRVEWQMNVWGDRTSYFSLDLTFFRSIFMYDSNHCCKHNWHSWFYNIVNTWITRVYSETVLVQMSPLLNEIEFIDFNYYQLFARMTSSLS